MKGIIGRKAGMTSVFTDHGKNIPVTVIEVQPNVVTNILSIDKHGYKAIQLAAFDRREKTSTKPLVGHFKKANTGAKRFVREIRNMEGYELGAKVDSTIFASGELVDVTGTSKGHGFQGNIKRHNQSIGPKSHGGGGGSQPVRQVGSIGDVSSNRVFKGMTMPGQMGNTQVTVQNLEIISIDKENNLMLVKGSIPGPNKSFVVIKEAIKGLPSKEPIQLVNVKEAAEKNNLVEEAKKWGADVNTEMSLTDMKAAISAAKEASEAEAKAKAEAEAAKKAEAKAEKLEEKVASAKEEIEKAHSAGDEEKAKEAQKKAESLEKQAEVAKEEAVEEAKAAKEAKAEAQAKEVEAEKLQVETKKTEEPKKDKSENKGGE